MASLIRWLCWSAFVIGFCSASNPVSRGIDSEKLEGVIRMAVADRGREIGANTSVGNWPERRDIAPLRLGLVLSAAVRVRQTVVL